jgi:Protein of unknown function (DUF1580)
MAISLTEDLLLLAKANVEVPGRPHPSTVARWALKGINGVKLETLIVGGRRYTSYQAVQRFLYKLNEVRDGLTKRENEPDTRRQDQIERELDQLNFR